MLCTGVLLEGRLVLGVDNTAVTDIAHDVGVSSRTKQFDRAIHYLRDLTQLRRILPHFVSIRHSRKLMATLKHLTSLVTSSGCLLHFTDLST